MSTTLERIAEKAPDATAPRPRSVYECIGPFDQRYALKMLRLAGMVSFRKDGRMVFYRLSDGFPHPLLEHCLRQLLTIASPEDYDAGA